MSDWAEMAAPIIAKVIAEHGREDTKELRLALRDAYPFGERRYYPYKEWLKEVKRQLGRPARQHDSLDMFA